MTCSITYSGNWAPVMRWFNSVTRRNFTDDNITLTTDNPTVTSQLTVTASADLHSSEIVCVTYFDAQSSNSLPTSATNIPSYRNVWTSPKLNVLLRCKFHLLILHPHCFGHIDVLWYLPYTKSIAHFGNIYASASWLIVVNFVMLNDLTNKTMLFKFARCFTSPFCTSPVQFDKLFAVNLRF